MQQSKTQYLFYNHNQLHVSANDESHHQADHKKIGGNAYSCIGCYRDLEHYKSSPSNALRMRCV